MSLQGAQRTSGETITVWFSIVMAAEISPHRHRANKQQETDKR
jgi:hypothetical protein